MGVRAASTDRVTASPEEAVALSAVWLDTGALCAAVKVTVWAGNTKAAAPLGVPSPVGAS